MAIIIIIIVVIIIVVVVVAVMNIVVDVIVERICHGNQRIEDFGCIGLRAETTRTVYPE